MTTYAVSTGPIAVAASTTKTLILLTPGDRIPERLCELAVSFDGTAAGAGIGVELYRTTAAGSPVGTAATPVRDSSPAGSACSAAALTNLTTEPGTAEVLRSWYVAPFGGFLALQWPPLREPVVLNPAARLGLRMVTPASVAASLNARATLVIDE